MPPGGDKTLLRVLTCGSVDDGKSTLLGRLMFEAGAVAEDQLARLEADSRRFGTRGGEIDYALLFDGLSAEREQGITIDVAHRYFETERRKFIVADAPGHEQYTRNMATAASRADAAVLLVDARKGVLAQTRRHSIILSLLGIRQVAVAINKMDLTGFDRDVFETIQQSYAELAARLELTATAIPISAVDGDNVLRRSPGTAWYEGPTLLDWLHAAEPERAAGGLFIMPVQSVNRAGPDFRGYAGLIASGEVRPGDKVRLLPSGRSAEVARLVAMGGDRPSAAAGEAVMLALTVELDCSRGDIVCAPGAPIEITDQVQADLIWMGEQPMLPGRSYWLKLATSTVGAWITDLRHELDVSTLEKLAAKTLGPNAIGTVNLALDRPIPLMPYRESRELGGFILIDRETSATVGAGLIRHPLRRAANVQWQELDITRETRAAAKGQRPKLLWFTGLSGAGKTTIANLVDRKLHALGRHSFVLDGDNVRHGLSKDLGFTDADRVENIRRVGEAARLMTDAGLIVLVALISPFRADRAMVRRMVPAGEFVEIFIDAPLDVAEQRDPKGLYAKARRGELVNFTGIDSPYEPPADPEIRIDTTTTTPEQAAEQILRSVLD